MVGAEWLGAVYGAVAARRRRWYATHPNRRRRLRRPVVSVGALTLGGSGKTPVAAEVTRTLTSMGEHPAILSRGYGRRQRPPGAVVVSHGGVVRESVDVAGDEPLMLARRVADASVVVAEDRYVAGRIAEMSLGASVHVLDDGYQHLRLDRDLDIVVLRREDLDDRPVPAGRLRESVAAAQGVDAVMVETEDDRDAHTVGGALNAGQVFRFVRRLGRPQLSETSPFAALDRRAKVLAVCGIARPEAFVDSLRGAGYDVVDTMSFRDHHRYSSRDLDRIGHRLTVSAATHVVTTEKDAVRLESHAPFVIPLAWVPLEIVIEPAEAFRMWLTRRLALARAHCS